MTENKKQKIYHKKKEEYVKSMIQFQKHQIGVLHPKKIDILIHDESSQEPTPQPSTKHKKDQHYLQNFTFQQHEIQKQDKAFKQCQVLFHYFKKKILDFKNSLHCIVCELQMHESQLRVCSCCKILTCEKCVPVGDQCVFNCEKSYHFWLIQLDYYQELTNTPITKKSDIQHMLRQFDNIQKQEQKLQIQVMNEQQQYQQQQLKQNAHQKKQIGEKRSFLYTCLSLQRFVQDTDMIMDILDFIPNQRKVFSLDCELSTDTLSKEERLKIKQRRRVLMQKKNTKKEKYLEQKTQKKEETNTHSGGHHSHKRRKSKRLNKEIVFDFQQTEASSSIQQNLDSPQNDFINENQRGQQQQQIKNRKKNACCVIF